MHNKNPAITQYPSPIKEQKCSLSKEEKIDYIATRFKEIMEVLDLDLEDPSLQRTPYRVAKMYVNEIFSGLDENNFPELSFIEEHGLSDMVMLRVGFTSFCEHHFVPMNGTVYVAYKPNKKLIGLSKVPRIVKYFSKRPQVQERLTAQIGDALSTVLETEDVAVYVDAKHYCVIARGIEDQCGNTVTHRFRGVFEKDEMMRKQFMASIRESV